MGDRIVTIAVQNQARAEVLKSRLNAEGIDCYLKNVNVVHSTMPGGVEVRVHEDDMEKALRIVEKVSETYRDEDQKGDTGAINVQKIMVPVDFSVYAKNACQYAIGLAEKLNASIKLLHVYYNPIVNSMPMTDTYYYQVNLDEIIRDIELRAKEKMETFFREIQQMIEERNIRNITLDYALVRGISHEEILIQAAHYKPDVIVIGIRGEAEKSTDLMGGVARRITENATVPVLVIPESSDYKGITNINIMYVTEFDDSDFQAISKLLRIISSFGVRLYCVHIAAPGEAEIDQVKMERLKQHVHEEYSHQHFECDVIEKADKLKGIQEFIEEKKIDILSLVTHKRNIIVRLFNPGIEKKLLFHSNVPLLVFHAEK
jgi:nucleotide-binding universal stress UspA family protein